MTPTVLIVAIIALPLFGVGTGFEIRDPSQRDLINRCGKRDQMMKKGSELSSRDSDEQETNHTFYTSIQDRNSCNRMSALNLPFRVQNYGFAQSGKFSPRIVFPRFAGRRWTMDCS